MEKTIKCARCGKTVPRQSGAQRYCAACRKIRHDESQKRSRDKMKAGKEQQYMKCTLCGKETPRNSPHQKYCPECAECMRLRSVAKTNEANKVARAQAAKPLFKSKLEKAKASIEWWDRAAKPGIPGANGKRLIPNMAPPGWSLEGKSAGRVCREANALGLSYGIYVAACNFGSIERVLADRGISPKEGLRLCAKAAKGK